MSKYDDIINLEHHVSKKRIPMSMESRVSQFAPFSALTGYDDALKESSKYIDKIIELDEESQNNLNKRIDILDKNIQNKPKILVTYFKESRYVKEYFNLRRIDKVNEQLIMTNKSIIKFSDLIDIESNLFD